MSNAGSFLSGAQNRLLPASVPFRFFASATVFHVLFWILIWVGANDLASFSGGPGIILAATHALTLGVLAMSAMGAAFQLLPIATHQSLGRKWPATLCFWLFVPGSAALVFGMATGIDAASHAGALGAGGGILVFVALTGDNLRRAGKLALIAAHGWIAIGAAIVVVALGIALLIDFKTGFLVDHQALARAHMALAVFGFMGLLATGFSRLLIPMFALSQSPTDTLGWGHLGVTSLALCTYLIAQSIPSPTLEITALLMGLGAAGIYVWQMINTLKTRMRKKLGLLFLPIIGSWFFLIAGLVAGLFALVLTGPNTLGLLFGFLVLAGWLLTFLLGILQRIMPFLASMHATKKDGTTPLLSDLTPLTPLKINALCHFSAIISCAVGIVLNIPLLVSTGAIAGVISALSFGVFTTVILRKMSLR